MAMNYHQGSGNPLNQNQIQIILSKSQVGMYVVYHWTRNNNSTELSNTCGASKFGLHQFPKLSSTTQSTSAPCSGRPRIWPSINQQVIILLFIYINMYMLTSNHQQNYKSNSFLHYFMHAIQAKSNNFKAPSLHSDDPRLPQSNIIGPQCI